MMHLLPEVDPAFLEPVIHDALRTWHSVKHEDAVVLDQLLLTHRADSAESAPPDRRAATYRVLKHNIERLKTLDAELGRILELRFVKNQIGQQVASTLNISRHQMNRRQRKALTMLAEIIVEQELLCRSQWVTTREQYLPPASHDVLFGFESAQQLLSARLRQPSTPWLFVLSGLGGSGKTALAQCLARDAIAHFSFSQFNWIEIDEADTAHVVALSPTAQRRWIAQRLCDEWQLAPASDEDVIDVAYARLKAQPHLIVIDHVPAGLSTADLADQLLQWANPSKFIVTTRRFGTAPASACAFTMPALDRAAAIALIRHDAEARELLGLADAPDDAYDLIYDVVGGHPAALKLIVALAERLPMAALLDDFTQARLSRVADLFDDVFAAAWAALSPEARTILWQCRTAAAAGLTVEQIVARAEVPSAAVPQAIDELVTVSLIRPNGSAWEKRYVVAPLTRLYLDAVLFALQD